MLSLKDAADDEGVVYMVHLTNPDQDGFARGVLQEFSIGDNGQIIGVFTNGLTQVLGQVAL